MSRFGRSPFACRLRRRREKGRRGHVSAYNLGRASRSHQGGHRAFQVRTRPTFSHKTRTRPLMCLIASLCHICHSLRYLLLPPTPRPTDVSSCGHPLHVAAAGWSLSRPAVPPSLQGPNLLPPMPHPYTPQHPTADPQPHPCMFSHPPAPIIYQPTHSTTHSLPPPPASPRRCETLPWMC
jgi:hypothetical protein